MSIRFWFSVVLTWTAVLVAGCGGSPDGDPLALYEQGRAAFLAGDEPAAIDAFYDALSLAREQSSDALTEVEADLRRDLTLALLKTADAHTASAEIQILQDFVGLTPTVHLLRGELARFQSRYHLALGEYQKVLEKEPENAQALVGLGFCQLDNKAKLAAQRTFQKALAIDPDLPSAHTGMGIVQYKDRRDLKGARKLLEKALELDPDQADAHQYLGDIDLREGHGARGLWHFREVMRLDPGRAVVAKSLRRMGVPLTHEEAAAAGEEVYTPPN